MNILSRSELRALAESGDKPCVSIFMSTLRAGPEVRQNPTRLKNLLSAAEEQLEAGGLRAPQAKEMTKQAHQLFGDAPFWEHMSDGLAMFLSPERFHYYRLPAAFPELVVVADNFHIKPLIPLFTADGLFYVLALSQDRLRLLQCTRLHFREIELKDSPKSLAETLKFTEFDKGLQMHTTARGSASRKGAVFHGHGSGVDEELKKKNLADYLHMVDKALRKTLVGLPVEASSRTAVPAPVVLAGVDFICSTFKGLSGYPNVMAPVISGNPDKISAGDLHKQAWAVAEPSFLRSQNDALDRYRGQAAAGRKCEKIEDALLAAYEGRVETIFVSAGQMLWGKYDPKANAIALHAQKQTGDEDLLDWAAVHTLLHGGTVFALAPDKMPNGSPLAAMLRH